MDKKSELEVIRKFRQAVDRETLPEDVKVTCRISGGMPSERVEEEFRLSGVGTAGASARDVLRSVPAQEVSGKLEAAETRDVFRRIASSLKGLPTRSEARFLPDSVVGTITVEAEGKEATVYFLADEEQRDAQEKPIPRVTADTIQHIKTISRRLLRPPRGKK
jgi:hypothetical protein